MKKKITAPVCGVNYIDEVKVKRIEEKFPEVNSIFNAAEILKILGENTRFKIVYALALEEMCVCDISALIGVSVSAVSHQLRLLRSQRLVKYRKKGKMVYYSLADEHVNQIIEVALKHATELIK